MMTLPDLASRLRLDRQAHSWRGDCPACAYSRAFSLRAGKGDAALAFCANGCSRDDLRAELGRIVGGAWKPAEAPSAQAEAEARERKQTRALALWAGCEPALGTLADAYLTARGLPGLAASPALRYRPDCAHPEGGSWPALVAVVTDQAGSPLAVHRTYLRRDGTGKAPVEPEKASLGPVWGGAIRLADPEPGKPVVIGEGVESSASAGRLLGCPAWAGISAGNLGKGLALPPAVDWVVIASDPDEPGQQAAKAAAARWMAEGRRVQIARPNGSEDFNAIARSAAHG